jgi:hypothetical protein
MVNVRHWGIAGLAGGRNCAQVEIQMRVTISRGRRPRITGLADVGMNLAAKFGKLRSYKFRCTMFLEPKLGMGVDRCII